MIRPDIFEKHKHVGGGLDRAVFRNHVQTNMTAIDAFVQNEKQTKFSD